MKRDEHVNDMPDIEIIDLENETVQDTDFGKSDISDDFEGNPDDEYEENDREEEEEEHPAPKGIRRFLNLHVLFALACGGRPAGLSHYALGTAGKPVGYFQGRTGIL